MGARSEPRGRARAFFHDFEAHSGSMQRESREKCTALPTGAVGASQVRQAPSIRTRGFTLVELLVALALGLFLIGGAISVFVSGKAAYTEIQRFSELQSNLGFVVDLMTKDIRGATGPEAVMPPTDINGIVIPGPADPVIEFTVTRPGGLSGDRNCLGVAKTGSIDQVINTYRFDSANSRLVCETDDGALNTISDVLITGVTGMVAVGLDANLNPVDPADWPDAFAVRITLTLESTAAGAARTHVVTFVAALRNRILNTYNTIGAT